jgi:hypothetical protein
MTERRWCDECQNTGFTECLCGGDMCACGAEEINCPDCKGVNYIEGDEGDEVYDR